MKFFDTEISERWTKRKDFTLAYVRDATTVCQIWENGTVICGVTHTNEETAVRTLESIAPQKVKEAFSCNYFVTAISIDTGWSSDIRIEYVSKSGVRTELEGPKDAVFKALPPELREKYEVEI